MAAATRKSTAKSTVKTAAKSAATSAEKAAPASEDPFKTVEDFTAAARDQFETAIQSFNGNMTGLREQAEELTGDMRARFEKTQGHINTVNAGLMEAAQTEVADAVQFANDLAQAKTFADALDVQRNYWTNLLETRVECCREMTEASVNVAREAMTPAATSFGSFYDASAFEKFFPFGAKA